MNELALLLCCLLQKALWADRTGLGSTMLHYLAVQQAMVSIFRASIQNHANLLAYLGKLTTVYLSDQKQAYTHACAMQCNAVTLVWEKPVWGLLMQAHPNYKKHIYMQVPSLFTHYYCYHSTR